VKTRRLGLLALAAALVVVAAVVVVSDDDGDGFEVRLELANAAGLREGRPVRIAGAEVGEVSELDLRRDDVVVAELELDPDAVVGRGATAAIKPTNLLAERFVEIRPGDLSHPEPSGTVIPRSRTSVAVDLDQLLDVLDADTRTRLGILINETGLALTGRKADFNALLEELPGSLDKGEELLGELVADNEALGRLVERGQSFVSRLAVERAELSGAIDSAGEAMRTFSARRAELRQTLERAPRALSTMQRFLADLRETTEPLAPAARAITASAGPLESTLAELEPFREGAEPALAEAAAVAPELTRLADEATPVVRRSNPTLRSLTRFAGDLAPVTAMLHRGTGVNELNAPGPIDDALNILHLWAQAIQGRDGPSHMFRGFLLFNNENMRQLLTRLTAPDGAAARAKQRAKRPGRRLGASTEQRPTQPPAGPLPGGDRGSDRALDDEATGLLSPDVDDAAVSDLLDFMFGP